MSIELLPQAQANALIGEPFEHGAVSQLTGRSDSAQEEREKRIYTCRHCTQARSASSSVEGTQPSVPTLSTSEHMPSNSSPAESSSAPRGRTRGSQPTAGREKGPRVFTFNGLRSHAKEKYVRHMSRRSNR